jgi:hypothetical protein
MGTSVRVPARLERLVARVARQRGATKSEVIRSVIVALERGDRALYGRPAPYDAMKHLIGCASGGPPDLSTKTGEKFRALLLGRRPS